MTEAMGTTESGAGQVRADRDAPWLVARAVSLRIDAPPEQVFALVSDVTRIGEWSPECHTAGWVDDQRGVGAQFRGRNRWGANRWSRVCEVTRDETGRCFEYRTVPAFGPSADSTLWGFDIEAEDAGCTVTHRMQPTVPPKRWFRPFIRRFMSHHLDMRDQMRVTLEAIRATAESGPLT